MILRHAFKKTVLTVGNACCQYECRVSMSQEIDKRLLAQVFKTRTVQYNAFIPTFICIQVLLLLFI